MAKVWLAGTRNKLLKRALQRLSLLGESVEPGARRAGCCDDAPV